MTRSFYSVSVFLLLLIVAAGAHYLLSDRLGMQGVIDRTVAVTGLASPALGALWYEPRFRRFEASVNPVYPELLSPDRFGFVYGGLYGR